MPEHDDRMLFELLILENFQAGLSWECVLNKRPAFREAFNQFDLKVVCEYNEDKITEIVIENGVKSCHIIDGRIEHAMLYEIFTTNGIGTMIFE